ncbi:MAG: putative ABC transport system permease protein, partial [Kiritimatiellia bacterium]
MGLDPVRDAKTLAIHEAIYEGDWLDDSDPKGVVIGRGLARTLAIGLGSEVVVLSQDAHGGMANDLFIVRGVLMSVGASTDRSTILMTETTFRKLMVFPEGTHKIIVRKPRSVELEIAA